MSSIGQALGGIVGGAIGFFVGGPTGALYGAQIGMSVGGLLDPPQVKGPRLEDLSVQTSTYGAFIPRVYGTVAITGNIFWVQADKLIEQESTSSGKGGPELTSYSYYATFAVGLCEGPIAGVRRIWIGGQLWYDAGADDLETVLASNKKAPQFVLYPGTDVQEADPLIQADRGAANTPAYRGMAYLVFELLPLEKYSNSLMGAQVKVEVVMDAATPAVTELYRRVLPTDYNPRYSFPISPDFEKDIILTMTLDQSSTPTYNYDYLLYKENTYPSTAFQWGSYGDGFSDHGTFVHYNDNYSIFRLSDVNDDIYTGFSDDYDTWATGFIDISYGEGSYHRTVWNFFKESGADNGVATVVYVPQKAFQEVVKYIDLGTKNFSFAYSEATSQVVVAITGMLYVFDFETGEPVDNVSSSFTYSTSGNISISNGIVWHVYASTTFRYLKGYSLTSGSLLYSYDLTPAMSGLGGSSCQAYVNKNLMFYLNQNAGSSHFFTILRLPIGSVDAESVSLSSIVSSECLKSNILEASDIDVTSLTDMVRGYRVSQQGPLRGGIDQLRKAWPFDVRQHGYVVEFVRRGGSSVVTVPAEDLDAREAGQSPGVSVTDVREMDLVLPQKVQVHYLDVVREYDSNEQSDDRPNTDAVNQVAVELPIVLNAEEAKQTSSMLLDLGWMERYDVALVLPPTYQQLEPADPITVNADNATYNLRLSSVGYLPDGRLECRAKYDSAAVYTQVSVADEGQSTGNVLALDGPTEYVLLDIPLMSDDTDTAGFPVAMAGITTDWSGGLLYRSTDGGSTWTNPLSAFYPGATIGTAAGTLSAHGGTVYDFTSTLTVYLDGGKTLASVTEAQLFSGQNWFAYGADGRWEIIAARTVTMVDTGIYTLQDFLRGQKGTEWASGLHEGGDSIVLLDSDALGFVSVNTSAIGVESLYRGITIGDSLDTDSNLAFTYNGVNLECLSPVNPIGTRNNTSNKWTISWTRRSRYDVWLNYVDTPLGETTESYEIDIYSDGTYATVVRTLTATTETVDYSSANQVTDFGASQITIYYKIYQLSATMGRGYALTGSSTATAATVALLHFNGIDAATTFTDDTGKTWTAVGNSQLDTAQKQFGSASLLMDGTGDYISANHAELNLLSLGSWTVKLWVRANSLAAANIGLFFNGDLASNNNRIQLAIESTGTLNLYLQAGTGTGVSLQTAPGIVTTATWYYVEAVKDGENTYIFLDGVKVAQGTYSTALTGNNNFHIGVIRSSSTLYGMNGNIDETCVVSSYAEHTSDFTPPTAEFSI